MTAPQDPEMSAAGDDATPVQLPPELVEELLQYLPRVKTTTAGQPRGAGLIALVFPREDEGASVRILAWGPPSVIAMVLVRCLARLLPLEGVAELLALMKDAEPRPGGKESVLNEDAPPQAVLDALSQEARARGVLSAVCGHGNGDSFVVLNGGDPNWMFESLALGVLDFVHGVPGQQAPRMELLQDALAHALARRIASDPSGSSPSRPGLRVAEEGTEREDR